MNAQSQKRQRSRRRAATLVLAVVVIGLLLGIVALAVDVGYIVLVRTQLQVAADSAATASAASMGRGFDKVLAAAQEYAGHHSAGEKRVGVEPPDVELGTWDADTRTFTPSSGMGNAVRVTARRDASTGGDAPLLFARIFGRRSFGASASAVAMANPRDIAFVVDLSGSMNDDTEPCWATGEINGRFASEGYTTIGDALMQQLYEDFDFGPYPGTVEHLGEPWGVPHNKYAYKELTKNGGPLTASSLPADYRILSSDSLLARKQKAYSAIIDYQIARVMPGAKPYPSSDTDYRYWAKYLDYVIQPYDGLPPAQDSDRIYRFNNPNRSTFPSAGSPVPYSHGNKIGYVTYAQFMVDHGRDMKPEGTQYVPLSRHSPHCPWHTEQTAGGTFRFPPREQPTHAARRALIAALQVIKERNACITNRDKADWVSIISFDKLTGGGPIIEQPLTADYDAAMVACTQLQAVADKSASTSTESGMIVARSHIRPTSEGGRGRRFTNKVVVLLTDGVPNLYSSSPDTIRDFIAEYADDDFYGQGSYRFDAALMQASQMRQRGWYVFPVGVGLGTNYGFMDRLSRMGGTANHDGQSPRGTGNPAEYEQRLTDIFEQIITNPQVRLVQ